MSHLDDLRQLWPERTTVQHKETGATGVIASCPPDDPIATDRRACPTAHLLLHSSDPGMVWVRWADRPGCWMRPIRLQKIRAREIRREGHVRGRRR